MTPVALAGCGGGSSGSADSGSRPGTEAGVRDHVDAAKMPSDSSASDGSVARDTGADSEAGKPPPSGMFPGQTGNPVGYAAAPGYPGSLKSCPSGTLSQSGTTSTPLVYSFCDFVPTPSTSGTLITGSHLKFIGCRFQSNDVENYNVQTTGSDITFEYSSVTPLVSLASAPPHEAWPSAGAGMQLIGNGSGYQIDGNDGYEYGINIPSGGPVTIDHSDIWGFGNAVVFYSTTAQMTVTNTWIHDAADAAAQKYHTDGPGYLNGGTAPRMSRS